MTRLVLILSCLMLAASPVRAQIGPSVGGPNGAYGGAGGSRSGLPAKNHDDDQEAKPTDKPAEPPPSIPGAQPDADAVVIPSDKVAAEMSPNDALFDAINRGDLAAAKDALNRGAQLDSHNVLGQTPTDAAIDLSRNDITFLLLSMRGSAPSSRTTAAAKAAQAARHEKPTLVKATPRHVAPRAPVIADRGTPNPAVGFTGF